VALQQQVAQLHTHGGETADTVKRQGKAILKLQTTELPEEIRKAPAAAKRAGELADLALEETQLLKEGHSQTLMDMEKMRVAQTKNIGAPSPSACLIHTH
jgi:hypothetical protein